METNIRFHYLYRDSGNYKKFGHCDYTNPENLSIEEVEDMIRKHLIDREFFHPEHVGIPKFRFHRYHDDCSWYEFEGIEETKCRRGKECIGELIEKLKSSGRF